MSETDLHFDVVIVGLGKTGMSCVRYFSKQNLSIAVTDSRDVPPCLSELQNDFPDIVVYTGTINETIMQSTEQIILSPGISLQQPVIKNAIKNGVPVCGDIEIFCQSCNAPVIAITGSNGKSTVTSLVTEMANYAGLNTLAGGNIGTPALDLLNKQKPDLYVLELSSFQLETTFSLNAHTSVILNISPDHMDRYDSLESYAQAKKKIYSGQGVMVINKDDELVNSMSEKSRNKIYFSLNKPETNHFGVIEESEETWLCKGGKKIIRESDLQIKGQHNTANALAAMALASSFNIPETAMIEVLKKFSGLPHRCQLIASRDGINWYNDSKATNVGACIASIEGLCRAGEIILIAGGDSKDADLTPLGKVINSHVKHVILLGVDAQKLAKVIDSSLPTTFVDDLNDAVRVAYKIAEPGENVLLAPACASLDMFHDYQQRGDVFVAAVEAMEAS